MLNKKNPISYSRSLSNEIYLGWTATEEFSLFANLRKKRGARAIVDALNLLSINSVCIQQKDRIGLSKMASILAHMQQFLTEVEEL
jgi:hypothetical protein